MKHGLEISCGGAAVELADLVALGSLAERSGWDGVFFEDYLVHYEGHDPPTYDPWILLAAIAMTTASIRIGTTVTALPRRRPAKLAREAISVDHLSGGRTTLALGLGDPADRGVSAFREDTDPKQRAAVFDDALEVLLGLLSGQVFSHAGPHFTVDRLTFRPAPVQQPRLPVWIGGSSQAGAVIRRAAKADGIVPYKLTDTREWSDFTPDEVKGLVDAVAAARTHDRPFDVAIGGRPRRDDEVAETAYLENIAAAGATWWLEFVPAGPPAVMSGVIARGPLLSAG